MPCVQGFRAFNLPFAAILQVVLSIAAAVVAFTSITIGAAYGLENSTKLYALTFMLVSLAASVSTASPSI